MPTIFRNRSIGLWLAIYEELLVVLHGCRPPGHQGLGIGRALLKTLLTEASTANVGIKLLVLKANPAMHLYERLGFRVVDVGEDVYAMLDEALPKSK